MKKRRLHAPMGSMGIATRRTFGAIARLPILLMMVAVTLAAACGGDGGSPTAPTPTTPPTEPGAPSAPTDLSAAITPDLNGNTVTFTWRPVPDAAYLVEIGRQPGASGVAVIEVDQRRLTWDAPARGVDVDYFVRVRGKNGVGIGPPSNEVRVRSLDLRDYIEALFLSDGPLGLGQPSCCMGGFPVGSRITVEYLNTVPATTPRTSLERLATQVAGIAAMGLAFTYSETSDRERMEDAAQGGPGPPENHVWVYDSDECPETPHIYNESGSPVIICYSPQRVELGPYSMAHQMGHALGFQDLPRDLVDTDVVMLEGGAPEDCHLSAYEFAAVETAYGAGLRPGDRRQDFINAGVIEP